MDIDALAEALVVDRPTMESFLAGQTEIPLKRQLCLALLAVETMPAFARSGHQLRGQVLAAMAFEDHTTETHDYPPPGSRFS
jgi:hypothetical protein